MEFEMEKYGQKFSVRKIITHSAVQSGLKQYGYVWALTQLN